MVWHSKNARYMYWLCTKLTLRTIFACCSTHIVNIYAWPSILHTDAIFQSISQLREFRNPVISLCILCRFLTSLEKNFLFSWSSTTLFKSSKIYRPLPPHPDRFHSTYISSWVLHGYRLHAKGIKANLWPGWNSAPLNGWLDPPLLSPHLPLARLPNPSLYPSSDTDSIRIGWLSLFNGIAYLKPSNCSLNLYRSSRFCHSHWWRDRASRKIMVSLKSL